MRKTKLLLVAFMAMLGSSVFAQSWTPAEVAEGEFYLYNVGKGLYFGKGNAWGTQASMTELTDGNTIKVTLVPEGEYFFINTKVGNDAWGLENLADAGAVYTDQSRNKKSTWEFSKVSDGIYNIISRANHGGGEGRYLIASADDTILRDGESGVTEYAQWKLLAATDAEIVKAGVQYNEKKQRILAIDNGIDTSAADALVASATSVEDINAAIASLMDAFKNYLTNATDEVEVTSVFVVNPSFETGNTNGWTFEGSNDSGAKENSNPTYTISNADGNYVFNIWSSGNAISQKIENIPNGNYKLTALIATDGGHQVQLNANGESVKIDAIDKGTGVVGELAFAVLDGTATIGAEGVDKYWYKVDNFRLFFTGALTDLTPYKDALAKALEEAEKIEEGSIPADAYSTFSSIVSANSGEFSSAEDYESAISAINDAVSNAKPLISPYQIYLDKVEAVKNMKDEDVYTGSDAKETLEGVISETEQNVNAATTAEAIDAETAKLVPAAKAFVKNVTINPDACLDITCLIENPHFIYGKGGGNVATGWSLASGGSITEHRLLTHNFEAWHRQFDLSQTITDLPKGTFKVTLQGFARHDNASITDKTFLYCGVKTVAVKDIRAEWSTSSYYKSGDPQMGDGNYDSSYQKDGVTVYQPNGMTGAYYWFQKTNPETSLPFYTSEVETLLAEDGDLKIGFKCETGEDWVLWDNFHLYYYGSAIAVTLDEAEGSAYSEDIENANVTLKKTISEGWNTVILPIAATKSEIGATELYTYSGNEDGKLLFTSADEIEPNVPYLMKASAAISEPMTFNGVTVKAAAESLVAEGENFNFVGTYTGTTALEGDYVLTEDAFTKANGGNTIKAYRAYIKTVADAAEEEASARELLISIDGVLTAIDAIDGKKISTGAIYNLAGQKVKKAQKGVFIQDGKKVIVT
ncbi:MAG: hypothetical protein IKM76_06115 [Prevotella sp.]|nr:hypothetical protein [Prevotella sp.]